MLLIGLAAAKYHIPGFRAPGDYDIILSEQELGEFYTKNSSRIVEFRPQIYKSRYSCELVDNGKLLKVELHVASGGSWHNLLESAQLHTHILNILGCDMMVASLHTLITIKKTHIHFPIKWQKHIRDYHMLKANDCDAEQYEQDNDVLEAARVLITDETGKRFLKYKRLSLDMTNEEFFARSEAYVGRKYKHDDLHSLVMFYDTPMYTRMKNDQSKALCLESKWNELSFSDKIKAVKEEAYVIALERKVIPAYESGEIVSVDTAKVAFSWAIERICTTLTSGWFREFAIENWPLCGPNNEDYSFMEKFSNWELL